MELIISVSYDETIAQVIYLLLLTYSLLVTCPDMDKDLSPEIRGSFMMSDINLTSLLEHCHAIAVKYQISCTEGRLYWTDNKKFESIFQNT